jgi:CRISPR-associated protein Cmr4
MSVRILQAITNVHIGDGGTGNAIHLAVARERHTRWPFLPGSSLKGALRSRATVLGLDQAAIVRVFGPERNEGAADDEDEPDGQIGTLRVGGATLLALPVRSLTQTFALLTCPTALARFGRMVGCAAPLPDPGIEDALLASERRIEPVPGVITAGARARGLVFLEDLDLVGVSSEHVGPWASEIGRFCGEDAPLDHLVVVHDDVFAHACHAWTDHRTRNAIGEDGVVEARKLFAVESLPAETLWWLNLDGETEDLLPADGETFIVGAHQSVGLGRVAWYGART